MIRTNVLLTFLCVIVPMLHVGTVLEAAEGQPNILWITCEDMSARLSFYGDDTVKTPRLDELASQSVRYNHCYGTYGVCAPNRHTLIMGMYPSTTGAMAMRTWKRTSALHLIKDPELLAIPTYEATPPAGAKCFTEYLRANGYYCSNNSKTDYQFRTPITAWDDSSKKAHWRNRPDDQTPFFSVFNFTITHESKVHKQSSPTVVDPAGVELPPYYPDTPIIRRDLARHYDNIIALDAQVGEVLDQLEEDGLADDTIVFFFSDHGDGLPRAKRWVYDSGIHVPLLVRYPDGKKAGTTNDDLVSFVDFAPTVLSLAGISLPAHMQGTAFLGPAAGKKREYIFAFRDRMDPATERIRAVRDHRFKYVRNYRPDLPYIAFQPYRDLMELMQEIHRLNREGTLTEDQWQFTAQYKPLEEFYDTENDPHEIHNLAGDPKWFSEMARLREAHERFFRMLGDLGELPETELVKHLWPPDGEQPETAVPVIRQQGDEVQVSCDTEGASIAFRRPNDKNWQLYVEPFTAPAGTIVKAQAIRLGWKPSPTVEHKMQ
ncbi:sulfatase family protein [Rubinisphaera margarita]|uniref:sulfatase family protein n=1 Tax=Rubinisphaera margarita TaxID=2909586 RepID=UPI001EE80E30|nr:sulfatase [Rubinisphaera margarita]MCG6157840.1 sulfatase [Rubinisphaera margarita]